MRLVQLSDPHFGTEQPPVVEALRRTLAELAPDVLVLSGDITQRATRTQFQAAKAFIDSIAAAHKLAIPGNHDIPLFNIFARVLRPYARFQAAFGPVLEPELDQPGLRLMALNTTRPWRHKDGELSAAQVARVSEAMRHARPDQFKVVVVHQPIAVSRPVDVVDRLHGHDRAIQAWSDAGVHLVLAGHIHLPCVMPVQANGERSNRPMWAAISGTAVSSRIRFEAGNSFNLVEWSGAHPALEARLERWDYSAEIARFSKVASQTL